MRCIRYRAPDLRLYVDMPLENEQSVVEMISSELPLIEQLRLKQAASDADLFELFSE